MGVAIVPLSRRPSKVPADSGPMDSLRRTPPMQPNNSSYWGELPGSSLYSMVTRFVRGLIRGRLHARVVPVFGPSDVSGEWVWSDSGPWLCALRRV